MHVIHTDILKWRPTVVTCVLQPDRNTCSE